MTRVILAVIALYQDWAPFLLAIVYVAVDHGVVGTLLPGLVYNHPDAYAHPWKWALIHATLVLENIFTWAPLGDEPAHVTAGVVYALTGEFDLYNVNPPLARLVGAAPALLLMDVPPLSPRSDKTQRKQMSSTRR